MQHAGDVGSRVNRVIFAEDRMTHQGEVEHYFSCGQSALSVISAAMSLARTPQPKTILDFGSGAGRVTRWFKAAFPQADIKCCDVRSQDMQFVRDELGAEAWTVGTDVSELDLPGSYDLIWLGSVITHLCEQDTRLLVRKLINACAPNGLIALSFHGRFAVSRQEAKLLNYIHASAWPRLKEDYIGFGYGYSDYEPSLGYKPGYGVSFISLDWITNLVSRHPEVRLTLLTEQAWDGHHDVVVVRKLDQSSER